MDVAELSSGVVVANRYGNQLATYTSEGVPGASWSCSGPNSYPRGIAVDGLNRVYIADFNRHVIQVYSESGSLVTEFGAAGDAPGHFNVPTAVAVDASGNVFVADMWNHRIQKFSAGGITAIKRARWGELKAKYR